jgi:1-acyl-sn-glycerol-3-phosphate acyltransferase
MGRPVQGMLCVLALLVVTIPVNVVQLLTWLLLPRRWFRYVSSRGMYLAATTLSAFAEHRSKLELVLYGDELQHGESALVISNHLGAEFVHFFQLAERCGMMPHVRFVQNAPLKWIPINWTCYMHDHLFIKRASGEVAKEATTKQIRERLCSLGEDRAPVWMVLFPEGTWVGGPKERFIVDRSQAYARKSGLPILHNVNTPRAPGFCALVEGGAAAARQSPDSVAALYDITFAYSDPVHSVRLAEKMPPSVLDYLDGARQPSTPRKLHVHIRRVALPRGGGGSRGASSDDEGGGCAVTAHPLLSNPADYVQRSFESKEALLEQFSRSGAFPGVARASPSPPPALLSQLVTLLMVLGSFVVLCEMINHAPPLPSFSLAWPLCRRPPRAPSHCTALHFSSHHCAACGDPPAAADDGDSERSRRHEHAEHTTILFILRLSPHVARPPARSWLLHRWLFIGYCSILGLAASASLSVVAWDDSGGTMVTEDKPSSPSSFLLQGQTTRSANDLSAPQAEKTAEKSR